ncbi:Cation/H(+) antiporter 15 [Vitis vinifera]|uniref:Cation/H(+) antiporter 15 n=1 Tax=Vitis vinifera TaxID=29760 RepID=A0A438BTW9_VITVI|nr:Cation/H(+) antiporter 15 [Vitis vinifera]
MADVTATVNRTDDMIVCYSPTMITTNGIWQGDNPLDYSLPLFILQLTLVVVTTRLLVFILKPLRQPRVISEILEFPMLNVVIAIVRVHELSSSSSSSSPLMFPIEELMAGLLNIGWCIVGPFGPRAKPAFGQPDIPPSKCDGTRDNGKCRLLYFLFLVGVEMDLTVIRRTGKKAIAIAIIGMILPFIIGCAFSLILHHEDRQMNRSTFVLFLGVALSVTAFPVLARILAELKLINTELGRMAMSSALINDMCAWVLLAVAIALAENESSSLASLWVILSSVFFVVVCIFIVRPVISWMIRRTPEGESFSEFYICLILTGVMISGFVTDAIGTHSVFGAFVFGLVIPNGQLGVTLIEKLEDFVSGLLLPLFFAISGLKTDVTKIHGALTWGFLFLVIILACAGKIAGTLIVALFYQMPLREGIVLGLLMNTKGLVEMIVLNVGRDQHVLDDETFAIMVTVAVIMTSIIAPIVTHIYKPARKFIPYKRRTIQRSKPDGELRILVCIHTPRNVPTIINLLEASHPSKKSPICVYVLHLVELTGRASAMLIVHNTRKSGCPALNRTQAQSDHIINAFENYEQHSSCVSVQPLTAISPYSTMHEDICNLAEDKRVAFIIIPFHKQQTVDGGMEATNPAFRAVNQNVLANAPCSVGILVDRGLNGSTRLAASQVSHHIAVLFFGGPDDREALSYAERMSEHPGISLTVMRFIAGDETVESTVEPSSDPNDPRILTVITDSDREKQLDEEYINDFRMKNSNDESIVYTEKIVNNGEETVAAVRSIDSIHDLFIVGRGQGMISPLTAGLTDWSECQSSERLEICWPLQILHQQFQCWWYNSMLE